MRFLFFLLIILSCSTSPSGDPLKNTKKLVKQGHADLYANGAFTIPTTHVKVIPPGPDALQLAGEMSQGAHGSFLKALMSAQESVTVVADGTKGTYKVSKILSDDGTAARRYIQTHARANSKLVILKSSDLAKEFIGQSWDYGLSAGRATHKIGQDFKLGASKTGERLASDIENSRDRITSSIEKSASERDKFSKNETNLAWSDIRNKFVLGYAQVPATLKELNQELSSSISFDKFSKDFNELEVNRSKHSSEMSLLVSGSLTRADLDFHNSLREAGQSIDDKSEKYGPNLAALSALGWLTKAILWDATIHPLTEMLTGGIGYVLVNGVAYPTAIVLKSGANVGTALVELVKVTGQTGYEIVAPSAAAAVAGLLTSSRYLADGLASGAERGVAVAVHTGATVASKATEASFEIIGHLGSGGLTYIGVPLSTVGVAAGTALTGAVVMTTGASMGALTSVAGETSALGVDAAAKVSAAGVLTIGTTASVLAGAALGIFEVGKSVVVPAGYVAGTGIVLSYGTLVQLGAQSLLGVSDAAYLILSMEGPYYVIYGVKGVLGKGEDLSEGAIVDAKVMQEKGEVFYRVPASESEIKKVMDLTYKSLPPTSK